MESKILIKIENDYFTSTSQEIWEEDIANLVTELDIVCTIRNDDFINVVEENNKTSTKDKEDYKKSITVYAKGYSQGDWQDYTIYYDDYSDELESLFNELKKTFTHKHDYFVSKYEVLTMNGKKYEGEAYDHTSFMISYVEFPGEKEITETYIENYGKDYDLIEFNIN